MNDPEDFLTRWSRRKRGASHESDRALADKREHDAPDAPPAERAADDAASAIPAADSGPTEPTVDLSKLPPIESITAETDIRAFLAPGVPAELRLAALRRAWLADPKVRNFVGLNDYDFDFHTPGAIPGFGPLGMTDELRREAVRIVTGWQPEQEATGSATTNTATEPHATSAQPTAAIEEIKAQRPGSTEVAASDSGAGADYPAHDQDEVISDQATTQRNKDSVALQQEHSRSENLQTLARRGHGRALPE
jgi:Protein of unknown function (DUF3306)